MTIELNHCQWQDFGLNNQGTRIQFRIGADLLQSICTGSGGPPIILARECWKFFLAAVTFR